MPATINPIRKAHLKRELLNPKNSVKDAMLKSGYALSTADRSTMNKSVKVCQKEIAQELSDNQLIAKAYNTLNDCLLSEKKSDRIAAAQVLLKFKIGDISNVNNLTPEKIIIAYNSPSEKKEKNSHIPQDVVVSSSEEKSPTL